MDDSRLAQSTAAAFYISLAASDHDVNVKGLLLRPESVCKLWNSARILHEGPGIKARAEKGFASSKKRRWCGVWGRRVFAAKTMAVARRGWNRASVLPWRRLGVIYGEMRGRTGSGGGRLTAGVGCHFSIFFPFFLFDLSFFCNFVSFYICIVLYLLSLFPFVYLFLFIYSFRRLFVNLSIFYSGKEKTINFLSSHSLMYFFVYFIFFSSEVNKS